MSKSNLLGEKIPLIGCKLPILKGHGQEREWVEGEILSIRTINGKQQYYIHFSQFNKRLDEWVYSDRMDLLKMVVPSPAKKKVMPHPKVTVLIDLEIEKDSQR